MTDEFSTQPAVTPQPPPVHQRPAHPLDRPNEERRLNEAERMRIRTAWGKLVGLLAFLALLLVVSYLVPHIAEQTQYAITRGKQRAEYDFARQHLGESPIGEMSRAYQMVSKLVGPSVVHISTSGTDSSPVLPLSAPRRMRVPAEGQGSGVIIDAGGYILTNNHVIRGANDIQVRLANDERHKATIVGVDKQTDLAVLKIDAEKLIPAQWGDSEETEPGALVWAMG